MRHFQLINLHYKVCALKMSFIDEGLHSTKPSPSHWTDGLVPATFEVSNDSIWVVDKGCVTEWEVTYRTLPGEERDLI